MADTPEAKPDEKPAAKSSKIVPLLLVLNLGASGFAVFKLVTASPAAAAEHHEESAPPTAKVTGPVVALEPFVVNLDEPKESRYVKVTIQVEVLDKEAEAALESSKQVVRDMILSHLSGLKLADTLGTAGKDKLRADLITKLETVVGEKKIRRLFFQEFMVQ